MSHDLDDFPVLVSCQEDPSLSPQYGSLEGVVPASMLLNESPVLADCGLVRVEGFTGKPFLLSKVVTKSHELENSAAIEVVATPFPKRKDFLHPMTDDATRNTAYTTAQTFPIGICTIDRLPAVDARLAAFVPSIMHRIDVALLVQDLQSTQLACNGIENSCLVAEAISSPSAGEIADYNRLEFLGDTILKFCTVLQVVAEHQNWPESYLQLGKDRIVNNNNLAKAAQLAGLDQFILTKAFTGNKWKPIYVSELFATTDDEYREMSSKVLADVVEALIGAAFVNGGLEKSLRCIRALLPDEEWYPHQVSITRLLTEVAPCQSKNLAVLENLIGYHFSYPTLLVEAITHASFPNNKTGLSYERLEILGDAVLDLIIVPKLFAHPRKLKHWELHTLHGALVNGNFLAFCSMNYAIEEENYDVIDPSSANDQREVAKTTRLLHLHDFLRAGVQVMKAKNQCLVAFENLRTSIRQSLENGSRYPWVDLIAMRPPKFMSDIVESVLGAVYLDSFGDLLVCEAFLERLGIHNYMQRILDDRVKATTPKERLGVLAGQETVKYVNGKHECAHGKKMHECTVQVGGVDFVTVDACGSKDEAEAKAASEACMILDAKAASDASSNRRKRKVDVVMTDDGTMPI